MKKFLMIFLTIIITFTGCENKPESKQIYHKTIDYEFSYRSTFYKIKDVDFLIDEYNYGYIPYVRLWIDLSNMDAKTLRWFFDKYDTSINYPQEVFNYPEDFRIYPRSDVRLVYKSYDENNQVLFYLFAGMPKENAPESFEFSFIAGAPANFYKDNDGKLQSIYDYHIFKFSPDCIPFEYKDLSEYEDLCNSLRKLNAAAYKK